MVARATVVARTTVVTRATVAAATATAAAGRATAAAARARATVAITFVLQGQYVCVMAYAIRLYAGTETTEDSP